MRNVLLGLTCLLTACSPETAGQAQADQTSGPVESGPIARCMNLGGALEAPGNEGDWGYKVRRADLVRLKTAGFDTVRLPVKWSTRTGLTAPYEIDLAFLQRVDEVVRWAGEIGLNVVLNVHHYDELSIDPDRHESRLEAIWDQLAYHYATAPDFLIFETINEPHSKMSPQRTDRLNARLLARIREDNPDRWVILGTANWGNLDGLKKTDPVSSWRTMLTYHDYAPYTFTHQGVPWADDPPPVGQRWGSRADRKEMNRALNSALKLQEKHRIPVFVGEFGVYEKVPLDQRALWTKAMREGLEARGMSWCYWDYATTLKAYDQDSEAWIPEIKAALLD